MQKERITAKTITKNKLVALRFRENEYNLIKSKADKVNMNFTEFITRSALNKQITVVDGLPEILKEVKAIGRNLNQLTTLCNMGKIICPELSELKDKYSNAVVMLDEIARRCL
ncbi:MAG: plasmid mobilization relaxosome protein MobC [Ruminococcus sp.]|nr:plasmid mobilization relaxosome protein MobC [Ruminococcus sp.]MDD5889046.1 plasmid mobilization relaxosome protein MobC [Ruminococcus sp.]